MNEFLSQQTPQLVLQFVILLFVLWALLVSLGIVWQVEKRLDRVYKIFTGGLIVYAGIQVLVILEVMNVFVIGQWFHVLRLIFIIIIFSSLIGMQHTLRDVWRKR